MLATILPRGVRSIIDKLKRKIAQNQKKSLDDTGPEERVKIASCTQRVLVWNVVASVEHDLARTFDSKYFTLTTFRCCILMAAASRIYQDTLDFVGQLQINTDGTDRRINFPPALEKNSYNRNSSPDDKSVPAFQIINPLEAYRNDRFRK